MLRAAADAGDETSAHHVLTALLRAGSRQFHSFLVHFDNYFNQFLGQLDILSNVSYICILYVG